MALLKTSVLDILDIEPAAPAATRPPLDPRDHKMIRLLVAMGEPLKQVASKLGVLERDVEQSIKSNDGMDEVIRLQTALFPDPAVRVKRIANLALDTQLKLLIRSTSDTTLAKVSQDILDRAGGKATQITENRNLNINVSDGASLDRALKASMERLDRLEETRQKMLSAGVKK